MRNVMVKTIFSVPESHKKAFEQDSEIHKLLLSIARVQKLQSKTLIDSVKVKSPDLILIDNPTLPIQSHSQDTININPHNNLTTRFRQRRINEFCIAGYRNTPKTPLVPSTPNLRPSKILRNLRIKTSSPNPSPQKVSKSLRVQRQTPSLHKSPDKTRGRSPSVSKRFSKAAALSLPRASISRNIQTRNTFPVSGTRIVQTLDLEVEAAVNAIPNFKRPNPAQILENKEAQTLTELITVGENKSCENETFGFADVPNVATWGHPRKKRVEKLPTIDYHSAKSVHSDYIFPLPEDISLFNGTALMPNYVSGNKFAEHFVRKDLRSTETDTQKAISASRKRKASTPIEFVPTSRNLRQRSETPTPGSNKINNITPLISAGTPNKRRKTSLPLLTPVLEESLNTIPMAGPKRPRGRPRSKRNPIKIIGATEDELLTSASMQTGLKFKELRILIKRV